MKIDNFVRGCLAAIVLLLGMLAFRPSMQVDAASTTAWFAVQIGGTDHMEAEVVNTLNRRQVDGWQYAGSMGNILIFKK